MSHTKDRVMELMEADDSFDGESWLGEIILIQHQGTHREPHITQPRIAAQARQDTGRERQRTINFGAAKAKKRTGIARQNNH